jgi:hypothetical protein
MAVFRRYPRPPVKRFARRAPLALAAAFAATLAGGTAAAAVDFPTLKSGLWESQVTRDGAAAKTPAMKMCMDATVQKEMLDAGMGTMKNMCSKNEIRRDGNRMYGTAECKLGETTMKSNAVTTFTGDVAYRSEVKATYDPPMMGKSSGATVIEAKWAGPCPAGMQPGDAVLPDGRKINMRGAPGAPK